MRQNGHKIKKIAAKLNRAKSTKSRKLTRNKYSDMISYLPDKAHIMAKKRRHVQPLKIDRIPKLKKYILKKLEKMVTRCNCS